MCLPLNETPYDMTYVVGVLGVYQAADRMLDSLTFTVDQDEITGQGTVQFFAFCSDVFYWGTADQELIAASDLELLRLTAADLGEDHGDYLSDLFAARKRGMRPQGAYYKTLNSSVAALFDAAGPERETTVGNPLARETQGVSVG